MAYVDRNRARERGISGVAAAIVVSAVGFAVANGLAVNVWRAADRPFIVHEWRDTTRPPPPPSAPASHARATGARIAATTRTPATTPADLPAIDLPPVLLPTLPAGGTIDLGPATVPPPPPPAADRAARAMPRGDPSRWVREEDYPAAALRGGEQGRTGFRLDIAADGRPTACAVTAGSGSAELDAAACRVLMRRARFTPGRDAAGAPAASSYASSVDWRLPGE